MVQVTRENSVRAAATSERRAWPLMIVIVALVAIGFALTLRVFYPGVITYDAAYVYDSLKADRFGDWQPPVMAILWQMIDRLAPGSASMFLLFASVYWAGFGLLALSSARRFGVAVLALPVLALFPPAFVFIGVIWRDVLFAGVWLLAASLAFAVADQSRAVRVPLQGAALALIGLGVLLRPNAIIAAPLLIAYVLCPWRFDWRLTVAIYVPAVIALAALVQLINYGILDAKRQHPSHSIMIFDLGGITHFAARNQFPVDWTPQEAELLFDRCYEPQHWDAYWHLEPCRFVMDRLEREHLFGSPIIPAAWRRAVTAHPIAYVQHRLAFMWTFLAGAKAAAWLYDIHEPTRPAFPDNPYFMALKGLHDALQTSLLFRAGLWLLLCAAACATVWPRRNTLTGAFILGVCGSAVLYVASFAAVGVAADFRYSYWAVLAALSGGALALLDRPFAYGRRTERR